MQKKIFLAATIAAIVALLAFTTSSVKFIVTGKITDDKGQPIANVTIAKKGTNSGTQSNADGNYSITISGEKAVLVFSSVGYQTKEIKVSKKQTLNVVLAAATESLDEVVVIGYQSVKRKDLTAAVSSIQAYDLNNVPINNAATVLTGKVAGVQLNKSTGNEIYDKEEEDNGYSREGYDFIKENSFLKATENPLSTFSIDVDAASYSNVRRLLNSGQMPPVGAVRIEEMVNYFKYDYPQPDKDKPFTVSTEIAACPWNNQHRIALIGLQGKNIPTENLPPSNLVFLIDVSGSMWDPNKLPLVQQSMKLLTDQLREQDNVAIVVYAGSAGLVLPSTSGANKTKIKEAINALQAGGSTAGGEGIKLAYKTAIENFKKKGNNRVILCTDGDFNVGTSSDDELERLIEKERESGVFLTVLGFGMGNYQDAKMQKLADKGNGNHGYIDGLAEAKKMLVSEFGGTLFTIAKDVKLQIEFNPNVVQGYRLIGYENRMLAKEDFNDDKKDAGELGSGHTVTAIYEIIPVGIQSDFLKSVDKLKYQQEDGFSKASFNNELMTVKLRYKEPDGSKSKLIVQPVADANVNIKITSENFRFATAVAEFGMLLRNSEFKQQSKYDFVVSLATNAIGKDKEGYRKEFVQLVERTISLAKKNNHLEDLSSNK